MAEKQPSATVIIEESCLHGNALALQGLSVKSNILEFGGTRIVSYRNSQIELEATLRKTGHTIRQVVAGENQA